MSDVHIDFTGNDAQIQRIMQRLEDQNAKLILQNRMLAGESRESSREIQSSFTRQIEGIGKMAIGYIGIEQTLGRIVNAYREWDQSMTSLAQKSREFTKNLTKDITAAGDLPRAAEVEQFVETQRGVTRDQARQAFSGVNSATPTSPISERKALAQQAVRLAPTGIDLREFGSLLGDIHEVTPNYSAADKADLALSVRNRVGKDADKLVQDSFLRSMKMAIDSGAVKSYEHGFAYGVAAIDGKLRPETMEQVFNAAAAEYKPRELTPGKDNKENLAFNRFAGANPERRLEMLMTDQATATAVLGREQAGKLRLMKPENVDRIAAELKADVEGDFVGKQLQGLSTTRAGRAAINEQKLLAYEDWKAREYEGEAERVNDLRRIAASEKGFFDGNIERSRTEAAILDSRMNFSGHMIRAGRSMSTLPGREGAIGTMLLMGGALAGANTHAVMNRQIPDVPLDLQQRQAVAPDPQMDEQTRALNDINENLRHIRENSAKRPPIPRSVPVINAHTETR